MSIAEARNMDHTRRIVFGIALVLAVGCGEQPVELGPATSVRGLVDVTTERSEHPAKVVAAADVELSDGLVAELDREPGDIEVVVRVLVGPDGSAIGIDLREARPEGSRPAQRYGAVVAETLWNWSYEPARSAGGAVHSYLDVRFRYPRDTPRGDRRGAGSVTGAA